MTAEILTSLIDLPLVLEAEERLAPFIAGDCFRLRVIVTSHAQRALTWGSGRPLTISYRWFDAEGKVLDVPDQRSVLPTRSLVPNAGDAVVVTGLCPANEGSYLLQLSLILEEVHWAADASSTGWLKLPVAVRAAEEWPESLRESAAGKALRGALVAANLAAELGPRPLAHFEPRDQDQAIERAGAPGATTVPVAVAGLDDLVAFAIKQQQRVVELTEELNRRQRRVDELERQVQELGPGRVQSASAEQVEDISRALSELKSTIGPACATMVGGSKISR